MKKRNYSDYTTEEISRFAEMEVVIAQLNSDLENKSVMVDILPYSRDQIAELSRYQQICLADRMKGHI